jgi:hypothetical protein
MTIEDLRTPKGMTPWWPWIVYLALAAGVILSLGVYARQGWHIQENRTTAGEIQAIKADVEYLHDVARELRSRADRNAQAIERVEIETGVEANAEAGRNVRLQDRHDIEDERPE